MKLPRPPLIALTALPCLLLAGTALAQGRPAARAAAPAATCVVSEFRANALGTHDLTERGTKATDWIRRNAAACSEDQLRLLSSNRSAWLGNADSLAHMALIDGALEARLRNKPEALAQMFGATPPRVAGTDTVRAGELAPRPAPVVPPGTPAALTVAPTTVGATAPGGAPAPGAPRPTAATAPEVGKHFDDKLRTAVREYYTANRGTGPCPAGLILKNNRCESGGGERLWKLGQPLPSQLSPKDLPPALVEKLGAAPAGHRYQQVDGDVMLLADASRSVVDAVLDLGGIPPRA